MKTISIVDSNNVEPENASPRQYERPDLIRKKGRRYDLIELEILPGNTPKERNYNHVAEIINARGLHSLVLGKLLANAMRQTCCAKGMTSNVRDWMTIVAKSIDMPLDCDDCKEEKP
ncbi:MAG: hypothetical protein CNCCGFBP_00204 [Fimbriimonadaceae bacterium]|nr:hypothetical protein [Fimbriimonadaceae bacterium]